MVLPRTAKINDKNHLEIGGVDTVDLVEEFKTPLFVYDEEDIRSRCREYRANFKASDFSTEVIFAGKAFLSKAICKLIDEEGMSLDVSSGGELYLAKSASFPMKKVYMHGNNKTEKELNEAIDAGIGKIVVDSFDELDRLSRLAAAKGVVAEIFLRFTPGIKPSTHSYIQTGQIDSKFGFGLESGDAMRAIKKALEFDSLRLVGAHIHIGSQIFNLQSFKKAIEVVLTFVKEASGTGDNVLRELNLGGGLGIKYESTDEISTISEYCKLIIDNVSKEAASHGLSFDKVMIEPGRSIVGNAGVTLYSVGTIKRLIGIRTYVSVDGGMTDNLRPMLYNAVYEGLIANKAKDLPKERITLAGKHCESGDILIKDISLPRLELGDIICTPATGAYGYVMANNYNRQPRPAVVMVKDGKTRTLIRRESYEDLIDLDV